MGNGVVRNLYEAPKMAQKLAFDDTPKLLTTVYQPVDLQLRLGYFGIGMRKLDFHKFLTTYVVVKWGIITKEIFPKRIPEILTRCRAHFTGKRPITGWTFDQIRDDLVAMPRSRPGWDDDNGPRQLIPLIGAAALILELQEFEELNAVLQSRNEDELDELQDRQNHAALEVNSGRCFGTGFDSLRKYDLPDLNIRDIKAPLKLLFDGEEFEEKLSRLLLLNQAAGEVLKYKKSEILYKKTVRFDPRQIGKPPAWMIGQISSGDRQTPGHPRRNSI